MPLFPPVKTAALEPPVNLSPEKKAAKKAREPARQAEVKQKAVSPSILDGTRMYAMCACPTTPENYKTNSASSTRLRKLTSGSLLVSAPF
jgi:hypothetical protein